MFKRTRNFFRSLLRSEHGSAIPVVAMGTLAMVAATGTAIDMGRAQMVQARLSNALDAAGLAAGANISTVDIDAEVSKYFYLNYPVGYMGSTITALTATPNEDNSVIDLSATATIDTTLMKVVGIEEVTLNATSEVTRASKGLELVLVMDNTGSMTQSAGGGVTKLQAAKDAATDLVNILYGSNTTVEDLWIGIVPFANNVNIGSSRTSWVTGTFTWGTQSWAGCVDAREASNQDVTDDPPSVAAFPMYFWPCDGNNGWYGTNGGRNNCSTSSGWAYRSGQSSTTYGPNKGCLAQQLLPMTGDKDDILDAIDDMQAAGNTLIPIGMGWGWRMISPRWRGLWGGEMDANNLPLDYHASLMNKAVVLMTDGDNTIDNSSRGAYWYLNSNKLGTTNSGTAVTRLNDRTQAICTSMKAQGIIVYTVALGTNFNTASLNMLRDCATTTEHFFNSPTTADLRRAFRMIGDSLANLRISQ